MQNVIRRYFESNLHFYNPILLYIYTQSVSYVSGNTYIVVGSLVVPFPYFFIIK